MTAPGLEIFPASAEEGIEGLGYDVPGERAAVNTGVGDMIAGPALCIRHDRSPRGNSEDLTIPFPSLSPQGLTVSNSTPNAGSPKARYVQIVSMACLPVIPATRAAVMAIQTASVCLHPTRPWTSRRIRPDGLCLATLTHVPSARLITEYRTPSPSFTTVRCLATLSFM